MCDYITWIINAKEAVNKLIGQQMISGKLEQIISGKGSAFSVIDFQNYSNNGGIEHILITARLPRGNGQVQRTITTLIPALTTLPVNCPGQCYRHVDLVQQWLNSTYQHGIGMMLSEVVFESSSSLRIKNFRSVVTN